MKLNLLAEVQYNLEEEPRQGPRFLQRVADLVCQSPGWQKTSLIKETFGSCWVRKKARYFSEERKKRKTSSGPCSASTSLNLQCILFYTLQKRTAHINIKNKADLSDGKILRSAVTHPTLLKNGIELEFVEKQNCHTNSFFLLCWNSR